MLPKCKFPIDWVGERARVEGYRPTKIRLFQALREEWGDTSHQLRKAGFDQALVDPHYWILGRGYLQIWLHLIHLTSLHLKETVTRKPVLWLCRGFSLLTNKFHWFQIVINNHYFKFHASTYLSSHYCFQHIYWSTKGFNPFPYWSCPVSVISSPVKRQVCNTKHIM